MLTTPLEAGTKEIMNKTTTIMKATARREMPGPRTKTTTMTSTMKTRLPTTGTTIMTKTAVTVMSRDTAMMVKRDTVKDMDMEAVMLEGSDMRAKDMTRAGVMSSPAGVESGMRATMKTTTEAGGTTMIR